MPSTPVAAEVGASPLRACRGSSPLDRTLGLDYGYAVDTAEIKSRWLRYFQERGHEVVPSASLVVDDPTLLFVNAGMVPFKSYLLGERRAPWPRATTVQKCIRTLDIEEVGRTSRHGSFFQMNGNFSFGDYFKREAISFAWDLLTRPAAEGGYGLPESSLWVSIYDDDDEAADIWRRQVGVSPERLVRRGKKDNFWSMGVPGPCGPCSEIFVDRGRQYGEDGGPTVDEDRFMEIWNLVFMQYVRGAGTGKDNFEIIGQLPAKNIDTGMGLERIATHLQGVDNLYEIDEMRPVLTQASEVSGRAYGVDHEDDVRMRVVADHVRTSLMLISDGVLPGNEGRSYVLRRIIRRAVRALRQLGVDVPVLADLTKTSMEVMSKSYPDLALDFPRIEQVVVEEERVFSSTLRGGSLILDTAVSTAKNSGNGVLSGEKAFQLHDTYGFPIDLTLEMAAESGITVDQGTFFRLMREQRERARSHTVARKGGLSQVSEYVVLTERIGGPVRFTGYEEVESESTLVAIAKGGVRRQSARQGPKSTSFSAGRRSMRREAASCPMRER